MRLSCREYRCSVLTCALLDTPSRPLQASPSGSARAPGQLPLLNLEGPPSEVAVASPAKKKRKRNKKKKKRKKGLELSGESPVEEFDVASEEEEDE